MDAKELEEFYAWKLEKKQKEEAEAAQKKAEDERTEEYWEKLMNGNKTSVGVQPLDEED